jgi:hypothetical protein
MVWTGSESIGVLEELHIGGRRTLIAGQNGIASFIKRVAVLRGASANFYT